MIRQDRAPSVHGEWSLGDQARPGDQSSLGDRAHSGDQSTLGDQSRSRATIGNRGTFLRASLPRRSKGAVSTMADHDSAKAHPAAKGSDTPCKVKKGLKP